MAEVSTTIEEELTPEQNKSDYSSFTSTDFLYYTIEKIRFRIECEEFVVTQTLASFLESNQFLEFDNMNVGKR